MTASPRELWEVDASSSLAQYRDLERLQRRRRRLLFRYLWAALALLGLATFVVALVLANQPGDTSLVQMVPALLGPLLATIGAAVGFYFGKRRRGSEPFATFEETQSHPLGVTFASARLFSEALRQLGSEILTDRIGGIYLLEILASHAALSDPVREVLAAFVRMPTVEAGTDRSDVQAAMNVIGRMPHAGKGLDLAGAQLDRLHLDRLDLSGANLAGASLQGTRLDATRLRDSNLTKANLRECRAIAADFSNAILQFADFSGSVLADANFSGALLTGAQFNQAFLAETNFKGALLADASFEDAEGAGAPVDARVLPHRVNSSPDGGEDE